MNRETLNANLKKMTLALLKMVREICWNTISDNCVYILSETKDGEFLNFFEAVKQRAIRNKKKKVKSFDEMFEEIYALYPTLYEIDFEIFHVKKDVTIIEVQYITFDEEIRVKTDDYVPQLHCKFSLPSYRESEEKFDANWALGGIRHKFKMFLWRWKMKRRIEKSKRL
jgi:hypothetical protein